MVVVVVVYCNIYYFIMLFILFYFVDKTIDVGDFVKWSGKIDKVAFCDVKLLNFLHHQC